MKFSTCPECGSEYPIWHSPGGSLGVLCDNCGYHVDEVFGKDSHNPHGYPWDDDAYCFYCQRQMASPATLKRHVLTKHRDTYRAVAFEEEEREQNLHAVDDSGNG